MLNRKLLGSNDFLPKESVHSDFIGNRCSMADVAQKNRTEFVRKNVLFVSSAGGHLSQLLQLEPWWAHHDRHWVTFDLPDAHSKLQDESITFAYYPTTRNVLNTIRNSWLAFKTIRKHKPDVIISNGAGVAFPFFLMAKLFRINTVYLEVYDRINSKTLTGKLCKPLATEFLVQWPGQEQMYEGSTLVGALY